MADMKMRLLGDASTFLGSVNAAGGRLLAFSGIVGGAVIGAKKLWDGIKTTSMAFSDQTEALNKSNVVFQANGKEIEAWAATASKSFGMSKTEALDAAGSFGNMFVQLGSTSDEAAKMSQEITELAADFASFHNADITEVLTAQQAAFRGEYDSVQRFLPLMNAANVEQKALAMTGKENKKQLTAQDKALASYKMMLEGAGPALGDFGRTADGTANKLRTQEAVYKDLQAELGQRTIPIFDAVKLAQARITSEIIERLIPALDKGSDKFAEIKPKLVAVWEDTLPKIKAFIGELQGIKKEASILLLPFLLAFAPVTGAMVALGLVARPIFKAIGDAIPEDAFERVRDALGDVVEWINKISTTAIEKIGEVLGKVDWAKVAEYAGIFADKIGGFASDAIEKAGKVFETLAGFVKNVDWSKINPVKDLDNADSKLRKFKDGVGSAFGSIKGTLSNYPDWIKKFVGNEGNETFEQLKDTIGSLVEALGPLLSIIGKIIGLLLVLAGIILGVLLKAFGYLLNIITAVIEVIGWFFDKINRLIEWLAKLDFGKIGEALGKVKDFIVAVPEWFLEMGGKILEKIGEVGGSIGGWFSQLPGKMKDAFFGALHFLVDIGSTAIGKVKEGVVAAAPQLWDWYTALPRWIVEKISPGLSKLLEAGRSLIGKVFSGISEKAVEVFGWFGKLGGWLKDKAGEGLQKMKQLGKDLVNKIIEGIKEIGPDIGSTIFGYLPDLNPFGGNGGDPYPNGLQSSSVTPSRAVASNNNTTTYNTTIKTTASANDLLRQLENARRFWR